MFSFLKTFFVVGYLHLGIAELGWEYKRQPRRIRIQGQKDVYLSREILETIKIQIKVRTNAISINLVSVLSIVFKDKQNNKRVEFHGMIINSFRLS